MGAPGSGPKKHSRSNNRYGENRYTAYNRFREQHGKDEPYPYRDKDGVLHIVAEIPKPNRRKKNTKVRSDKGKKRNQLHNEYKDIAVTQTDIQNTIAEIKYIEDQQRMIEFEQSPERKEILRRRLREKERRAYNTKVTFPRQKIVVAIDGVCPLCENRKVNNKQWVITRFADTEQGAICKSCYWKVKLEFCNGDAEATKKLFACVRYGDIGKGFGNVERK